MKQYTISYAEIAELEIQLVDESTLRNSLWSLHQPPIPENPSLSRNSQNPNSRSSTPSLSAHSSSSSLSSSGNHALPPPFDFSRTRYRTILALSRDAPIPVPGLLHASELPIPPDILQVLGKTMKFRGNGRKANVDRIYIREKSLEILARFGWLIKKFHLKFPCGLVKGNIELNLVDTNTWDTHDELRQKKILRQSDFLVIAVDSRGLTPDICRVLIQTGWIDRWVRSAPRVTLVDLSEREVVNNPTTGGMKKIFFFFIL